MRTRNGYFFKNFPGESNKQSPGEAENHCSNPLVLRECPQASSTSGNGKLVRKASSEASPTTYRLRNSRSAAQQAVFYQSLQVTLSKVIQKFENLCSKQNGLGSWVFKDRRILLSIFSQWPPAKSLALDRHQRTASRSWYLTIMLLGLQRFSSAMPGTALLTGAPLPTQFLN